MTSWPLREHSVRAFLFTEKGLKKGKCWEVRRRSLREENPHVERRGGSEHQDQEEGRTKQITSYPAHQGTCTYLTNDTNITSAACLWYLGPGGQSGLWADSVNIGYTNAGHTDATRETDAPCHLPVALLCHTRRDVGPHIKARLCHRCDSKRKHIHSWSCFVFPEDFWRNRRRCIREHRITFTIHLLHIEVQSALLL